MRLKRVKIFGFKTFADKTEMSLDGDIIAIVGPNGCGKSNFVDAILWGLGEGNARQLRAQNNQDVIFNGSTKRRPLGYAEVTLLFDNEDRFLPIPTAEVAISRRLSRSGESEYSINRQPCRLRDILDLLADSGLGRSGYAIVGQKEVDQALAASAEDRRAWVDEAAGVQRYRARKLESLKRLSVAHEHLGRVNDILREIESQREPLREEAEAARRYKAAMNSLRQVESGLLIREIATAIQEVADQEKAIERALKLIAEEEQRAEILERQVRSIGENISLLEQEMDTIRGLQQGALTALERAESAIRLCDQKLESLSDLEANFGEEAESSRRRIEEAESDLDKALQELRDEELAFERIKDECAGAGEEAKRLGKELLQLEKRLEEARALHAQKIKLEAEASLRKQRRREVRREIEGIKESLPELEQAVAEAQAAFSEKNGKVKQAETRAAEARKSLTRLNQEDDKDAQTVRRLLAERAALEGKRRGIEATIETHEGLAQGARAVIEAAKEGLLKGLYLPVGQAVDVQREHAVAIETALGGAANDLIVEHESDAKQAIELLKKHRLGRATFQPIPLVRPVNLSHDLQQVLNERGVIGRASELVACDPKHLPVIESLLGRVVVVEDLDSALRLAKTNGWSRLVTLEGEVVHGSGAVSGGLQAKQGFGFVHRKAELAEASKQIQALDQAVAEAEGRIRARSRERSNIEGMLATCEEQRLALVDDAEEAREWMQSLSDERAATIRSLQKLDAELAQLESTESPTVPVVDLPSIESERDALLKNAASRSADAEQAEEHLREAESRLRQAQSRVQHASRRLEAAKESSKVRQIKIENIGPQRERIQRDRERAIREGDQAKKDKSEAENRLQKAQELKKAYLEESYRLTDQAKAARANALSCGDVVHQAELQRARADSKRALSLQRLFEEYNIGEDEAMEMVPNVDVPNDAAAVVSRLRREIKAMGDVNVGAIEAFERLTERCDHLSCQKADIEEGARQIEASIRELDKLTRERFTATFERLQVEFAEMFRKLFDGGEGHIVLTDPDNILESGIEIDVQMPGKKRQRLELLSGGERALCAVSFLFSLLKVKPSPLVVLDEVDAPLDGRNVDRFVEALREFQGVCQFIVITHNPTTIEAAPVWLGVTMSEPGVSTLVPAKAPVSGILETVLDGAPRTAVVNTDLAAQN